MQNTPESAPEIPSEDSYTPPPNCPVCGCRLTIEWSDGGSGQWPSCGWYAPHPHCAVDAGSSQSEPVNFFIGKQHDRPDLPALNRELERLGSEWRATRTKTIGTCLWHPYTQVHLGVDAEGYVKIPDVLKNTPANPSEPVQGVPGSAPDDATIRRIVETADEDLRAAHQSLLEDAELEKIILSALSVRKHTEEELVALADWASDTRLRSAALNLVLNDLVAMEWKVDEPVFHKKD